MPQIATKTTYLEMLEPPPREVAPPRPDLTIERIRHPSNAEYRRLYRAVGANLNWVDRLIMPDEQLATILCDERVEVYVLSVAGETAGYSELDRRRDGGIELAYFGLTPQFIGQGLGKYFLDWSLRAAWSHRPARVWVHTCDLDHPAALPNYLQAGFRIYDEQTIAQFIPDEHAAGRPSLRTIV